ncbi:MAG TPA: glycosyltransferase family 4 protein [Solirubrobacteraceae bacterium]|nr:glycosyltransferase family 4 protein [Solirubrobacteraceae bacterium]
MKPVLFVTGNVPGYRVEGLRLLHEREGLELATFGGRSLHGGPAGPDDGLPIPSRTVAPRELLGLAASGGYRAVVVSTAGRTAPLAAWAGARRAGVPVVLWASLWAHPRSPAQMLGYPALRRLYGSANAVVTYGPHVSAYVAARGAHNVHVAPQNVDNAFWSAPASGEALPEGWPSDASTRFLFVGRDAPEKGLDVLRRAFRRARERAPGIALVLAGGAHGEGPGTLSLGTVGRERLRDVYAACEVLVLPSIATRTFREPWGLVVNEAMNQRLAVIASDAVGAAAGGLVKDGENGLVVPAGDVAALSGAIERLAGDPQLRAKMGVRGAENVRGYTAGAWAEGFTAALASLGLARDR